MTLYKKYNFPVIFSRSANVYGPYQQLYRIIPRTIIYLKKGNSPYWQRPQFKTLTENTCDIIVIMLGTNDSKDVGDKGPNNWHQEDNQLNGDYATDYKNMIELGLV